MATEERTRRRAVSDDEKLRRRASILLAAKTVFAEKGFHATTIADVAAQAGLSYGSIYWYFDSKESLFHALMDDLEVALREDVAATFLAADPKTDGVAAFKAAVRATFEFFEQDRAATKILFRDAFALGGGYEKHLYGIYEGYVDDIEKVVVRLQKLGIVRDDRSRMLAFSVAALVGQLSQRRLATKDGWDAASAADFVVQLLMHGMLKQSG